MSQDLVTEILAFVQSEGEGVSSEIIAERFLKLQNVGPLAATMVQKILAGEPRLSVDKTGIWHAAEVSGDLLKDMPVVVCRCAVSNDRQKIGDVSLWRVVATEMEHLVTVSLLENSRETLAQIAPYVEGGRCVFFSQYEQRLLMKYLAGSGISLTDDVWPLSAFFRMFSLSMEGKREGLLAVAENLMTVSREPADCKEEGELLAEMVSYFLEKAQLSGYPTEQLFEEKLSQEVLKAEWAHATFTLEDTALHGDLPGVYGFKDALGKMLYVGKAKNLKVRLQSYFRISDESPQKIEQLRAEAVSLMMHPCGSEIEALITEHRLIAKYAPPLNVQRQVHTDEKMVVLRPSLFVLPAAVPEKVMTFWVGDSSDIRMQSYEKRDLPDDLEQELKAFFRRPSVLEPSAEKVIALRWFSAHFHHAVQIVVDECVDMQEVAEQVEEACTEEDLSGIIMR